MKISVIIPAHNEARYIGPCIESVLRHRTDHLLEIIVVDNASTDGTGDIARRFSDVTVVSEPKKGLTVARQRGLAAATGELLAYIDADCRIHPEWFPVVQEEFTTNPDIVCLGGMYTYYDLPRHQSMTIRGLWKVFGGLTYLLTSYLIVGGNFVARKSALEEIGGFDTSIAFYGEDMDIARRLKQVGKVRFNPRFSVATSGRRWAGQGFWSTGATYTVNAMSQVLFGKPVTRRYKDIR